MSQRITQIPLPGGSGLAPTGAMQFENDWPGLFIRGDQAIPLYLSIRELEQRLCDHQDLVIASALSKLRNIADIIEQDVVYRDQDTSQIKGNH